MNIMNHLTKKHMKSNRKRTIMTILGVIISVAMITAVSSATTTFMNYLQRLEMQHNGNYHMEYADLSVEQMDTLENEDNIKNVFYNKTIGYGKLAGEEMKNPNKPYLYVEEFTTEGLHEMNLKLLEGRFPKNEMELMIPSTLVRKDGTAFKVGEQITLDMGERYLDQFLPENILYQDIPFNPQGNEESFQINGSKTYQIVGIIERPRFEGYSAPGYTSFTYLNLDGLENTDTVNAFILESKVTKKIFQNGRELADALGVEQDKIGFNDDVLIYYGVSPSSGFNTMIKSLATILILIIMVGSISLIYNSFAISITERSKQFGMLSSVGATKGQKRNAVFFEGAIIGVIAIPIGIVAGIAGMGITFRIVEPMLKYSFDLEVPLRLHVSTGAIIVAVIFSILTIMISAYIPAKRASKISAMDAIRQTKDIKLSKKSVKTNRLVRKIFGIEGDIALKNLKRNKKRFRALVFSLFISLVMFTSVSSYVYYVTGAFKLAKEGNNYDISLSFEYNLKSEQILQSLREVEGIKEGSMISRYSTFYKIDTDFVQERITDKYMEALLKVYEGWGWSEQEARDMIQDASKEQYVTFNILDDTTYQKFITQIGYENHKNSENQIEGILINKRKDRVGYSMMESDVLKIKEGEQIPLSYQTFDEDEAGNTNEVSSELNGFNIKLLAVTDELPIGLDYYPINGNMCMIVSREVMDQILAVNPGEEEHVGTNYMFTIDEPEGIDDRMESAIKENTEERFYLYNRYDQEKRNDQMIAVMSIFAYGFITLISLICVSNLCNTIATSCSLRRREFAMLKSVGMTPKAFHKMIRFESMFYGIKALLYGLPVSIFITYLIYRSVNENFISEFLFPWKTYAIGIFSVFLVVGIAMAYSTAKIKNESIIVGLKSEIE